MAAATGKICVLAAMARRLICRRPIRLDAQSLPASPFADFEIGLATVWAGASSLRTCWIGS
jgi:hypothetical protein